MAKIIKNNAAAAAAAAQLEADLKKMREKMAKNKAPAVEVAAEPAPKAKKKAPIVEAPAPKTGKKKPVEIVEEMAPAAPKRGRPKGSKNKPKIVAPAAVAHAAPVAKVGKKKPAVLEPEVAPVAKPKKAKNSGPWSLREDNKVAHNGRVLQAERAAHYPTADGGAVWIVGRTVDNRAVFHATGIDGAGNALTPATFAGSPEIVCVILNAYCATLAAE